MARLLVLVALAVVLWMFLETGWARLKRAVGEGARQQPPEISLVRCPGCGVHVPRGQVVAGLCERCRLRPSTSSLQE